MRHLTSFRVRVFLFTAVVAVAATVATAWLTLRDASSQITASVAAERKTVDAWVEELNGYAVRHGTWEGVMNVVADLSHRSGERIRLTTLAGEVVVDSDHLAGQAARPLSSAPPRVLQPRPTIVLDDVAEPKILTTTLVLIDRYRSQVRLAACLTRHGMRLPEPSPGDHGIPTLTIPVERLDSAVALPCVRQTATSTEERHRDAKMLAKCEGSTDGFRGRTVAGTPDPRRWPTDLDDPADAVRRCAAEVFAARVDAVAPVPLLLHLGVDRQGDPGRKLAVSRTLAAAGAVALVVIVGTLLLSRRVVRPISTITAAARRLGEGDLSGRVAVRGHDELAELARAFNRMAEQLQRGEEQQRRMIGDIAHELRTPLANVRGYLEALADGVLQPSPELFASLHEEAVLQQRIVDDLQELALAEAGALRYRKVAVDVADLLESCRVAHQAIADVRGVTLRVELPPADTGDTLLVWGDSDRLRQAVANLIANALNATGAGGSVTLRGSRCGDRVEVAVIDTGHGIAKADLQRVFDRFWRADAARSRRTGGSGLGLAITREFVAAHAGTITVTSELGVGSVFTISLPALRSLPSD